MIDEDFKEIYSAKAKPTEIYYLKNGDIFFYISQADSYKISGQNCILGATEVLLSSSLNSPVLRLESALASPGSTVFSISLDEFFASLSNVPFAHNVIRGIAHCVQLTNDISAKNLQFLLGDDKYIKNLAIEYYSKIKKLSNKKGNINGLDKILQKHEQTFLFEYGQIFSDETPALVISNTASMDPYKIYLNKGSLVSSHDSGNADLLILINGKIKISGTSRNKQFIYKPGTAIGEITFLLNSKKSTTLKADENSVLLRLSNEQFKDLCDTNTDLMKDFLNYLPLRHKYNIEKINKINSLIYKREIESPSADTYSSGTLVSKLLRTQNVPEIFIQNTERALHLLHELENEQ